MLSRPGQPPGTPRASFTGDPGRFGVEADETGHAPRRCGISASGCRVPGPGARGTPSGSPDAVVLRIQDPRDRAPAATASRT
ncbi:hypothetical protein, partial [uncultured Microbacterium sp.]|uniref:hypothetical protein n=1 Tax=uncultured Microbacterium sp. TaxID=191216 RepID=UPI0028D128F7